MGRDGGGHGCIVATGDRMTLAVVVLAHDSGDDLLECLRSVRDDAPEAALVVVDNASSDGAPERARRRFPELRSVRNDHNRGFAAAANQGVRATDASVVVLLNPDARVEPGALARLAGATDEHPKAGAVGPLVRNPDGSIQPSKRAFPTLWQSALHGIVGLVWPANPGSRAYLLADADLDRPRTVGWVSASAVALRRSAFDAVGGFDEDYFFFVEDVDLCKRLWDAGWEIWFEPRATVEHAWGTSWTKRPLRFMWMHQRNLFRYVRKHRRGAWVLAYPFIAAGLFVRFAALALRALVLRRVVPAHRGARATDEGARA